MKFFSRAIAFACIAFGISSFGFAQSLDTIDIDFCNTPGKEINYTGKAGDTIDLCYTIKNNGIQNENINIGFVDGTFTNDQWKNKACEIKDTEKFGKYVSDYKTAITIQTGQTLTGTAKIQIPENAQGILHGCLVYSLAGPAGEGKEGTSFSIQFRKARFIDITVGDHLSADGKLDISQIPSLLSFGAFSSNDGENISMDPRVRIYQDPADNKYVVQLKLVNSGSTDEEVNITGVAQNFGTYKETFFINRMIPSNSELLITQKLAGLPILNLNVNFDIEHTQMIDPATKGKTEKISLSTSTIIFDKITMIIMYVGGGILFLIVLSIIIHLIRKPKNPLQPVATTPATNPIPTVNTTPIPSVPTNTINTPTPTPQAQ